MTIYTLIFLICGDADSILPIRHELTIASYRLSLPLADAWTVSDDPKPFDALAFHSSYPGLLTLKRSARVLKAEEAAYIDEMQHLFTEHDIITRSEIRVGELTLDCLHHRGQTADNRLEFLTYFFSNFDTTFTLTFSSRQDTFETLRGQVEKIASQMTFLGPVNYEETKAFITGITASQPDLEKMNHLLVQGARIDGIDPRGKTALAHAVLTRNAPLVAWLLDHGLDLNQPGHNLNTLITVSTPAIWALIDRCKNTTSQDIWRQPQAPSSANKVHWVTADLQLFSGIRNGSIHDVVMALERGADPLAMDINYQLNALDYTQRLIAEFEEVELSSGPLPSIVRLLQASYRPPSQDEHGP